MTTIILFGFKGCGKTYFGSLLARDLQATFIDTDYLIEQQYGSGLSCRQIAKATGEEGFRALERQVISSIENAPNRVIAVGGGAVLDLQNSQKLQSLGVLVYLEINKNILKKRIFSSGVPSFLEADDLDGSFEGMYNERKSVYEALSESRVVVDGKTDRQVLDQLKKFL